MPFKNHYQTLGISPQASTYLIKKRYRALAMQYHPDKNADDESASLLFRQLKEAYETLSHPSQRLKYDFEWKLHFPNPREYRTQENTSQSILDDAIRLSKKVEAMDKYRINQKAIYKRISEILCETNIALLQKNGNDKLIQQLIIQLISAASVLSFNQIRQVTVKLSSIAGNNSIAERTISDFIKAARRQYYWAKLYPFLVLVITIVLCVAIYMLSL